MARSPMRTGRLRANGAVRKCSSMAWKPLSRIEVAGGLGEVGAVDVRDEPEGHVTRAVRLERFVRHHRAEVGAADADVNDVAEALAGMALPRAVAHPGGEIGHAIQHRVHLWDDILAVDHDGSIPGRP